MNKLQAIFDAFDPAAASPDLRRRVERAAGCNHEARRYVVAFTPRSGSSWLTELLAKTKLLGQPNEWLNPKIVARLLERYPCGSVAEYLRVLPSFHSTRNHVFGIEASFYQYQLAARLVDWEEHFPPVATPHVYLYRLDLVAQAISLYKAVSSGYFHSVQTPKAAVQAPEYNAEMITKWLVHILDQEFQWRLYFRKRKIVPLTLAYEELSLGPEYSIRRLAHHVGVELPPSQGISTSDSAHVKIADETNRLYAERYYAEHADWVERCYLNRGRVGMRDLQEQLSLPPAPEQ
jgi:trehalose 2-sulfotransferase